ncbi:hydrogenase expression protein HypE [Roseomonas sp. GC11]|uniref:hydrogenase large subunit n=1 Tax=Roseomonas sp. GC11 TaxID=2950546 RepID=UPI002109A781|nr:hydrogenase expression protein HypE [Roseomonas sp. GC11]MCQ4161301.1 hydrogenase expression protein HypE [Roseomonas sp. GC11]
MSPVSASASVSALDLIRAAPAATPFRHVLDAAAWAALPAALSAPLAAAPAAAPDLAFLGLWPGVGEVHAAFHPPGETAPLIASTAVAEGGAYAALSPARPAAAWFERAVADLTGWQAAGGVDGRPWLEHGRWPVLTPLAARPPRRTGEVPQPVFLTAEGEGVHQIPVGPIHAGVIEPGHFRFHVQGEMILRLEARLGYTHKGVLGLLRGRSPRLAAPVAARLSGDSTVAHSWAFAMAAERATATTPPPRALLLRGVMAELERIANHLNDCGFLCNDAAFAWPHARFGALREMVLRAAAAAFGHRLMMGLVIPGGVARDLTPEGARLLADALAVVAAELPALRGVMERHASLQDRLAGTGILRPELAAGFAAGGYVGRASGRDADARRDFPYAPYDAAGLAIPVLEAGDVEARLLIRLAELEESLRLVPDFLARLAPGPLQAPLLPRAGEGWGMVEGFRGEVLWWLQLGDDGLIRAAFPRDPSWLHWPLLEAAVEGNIVADFPLCNKSFNASYSGVDL